MKTSEIICRIDTYSYDELPDRIRLLVDTAKAATDRAYSPYSMFSVGAAISLDNGEIISGSNQENVAYPSGLCAERTACFYAHSRFPEARFQAVAIAARGTDGAFTKQPTAPCGACRQALLEYEILAGHDVPVYLAAADKVVAFPSVKSTLPLAFTEF